jgi:hypothetical protein
MLYDSKYPVCANKSGKREFRVILQKECNKSAYTTSSGRAAKVHIPLQVDEVQYGKSQSIYVYIYIYIYE